jgi:hypothetical protein
MEVFTPDLDVTRSIIEAHVNCSKSYETNPEAGNNQHNKSIDNKHREPDLIEQMSWCPARG